VLARDDSGTGTRLAAYLVTGPDAPPSVDELRTHLARKLPEYMVPSAFVFLDSLPLTVNGKIDRKALPPPAHQPVVSGHVYLAPRNPVETMLAGIWQEVLQSEKVGMHDDIFEIGGDSLLIFQIATRAGQNGLAVTLPQIFQLRTIEKIAEALNRTGPSAMTKTSAPISRISRDTFRRTAANAARTQVPLT
jgi:aryl carrier-like protein